MAKKKTDLWEGRDFLDLWRDTLFVGQEFLTWLWLASEIEQRFNLAGGLVFELWFESSLKLESGQGDTRRQITCQTAKESSGHEWAEAFMAVMFSKKVNSGRLRIRTEEREWALTLPADTLTPKAVKMASTADPGAGSGDQGPAGQFLDRVALLSELSSIVEALLVHFLKLRLSPRWEAEELPRLRGWLSRWDREARGLPPA